MNAYQFLAKLPSNGSVASVVTLLVSAWFLVAAGAILTDPTSVYTQRATVTARSGQPGAHRPGGAAGAYDDHGRDRPAGEWASAGERNQPLRRGP